MNKLLTLVWCAVLAATVPAVVLADADGPDYFRVIGVAANDVLNIRANNSASSDKIGSIPPDGEGIKNLGCKGGLSYAEWSEATNEERTAAGRRRWCHISYDGVEGWVAGRFLGEGAAPKKPDVASQKQGANGISSKPMIYACDGLGARLTLVLFATDPGVAFLRWRDDAVVLIAAPAASGAKYETDTQDGRFVFWSKGDEATFTLPDEITFDCKLDDMG